MIKRYIDTLRFRLKTMEFQYRTWKNAKEISRAYETTIPFRTVISGHFKSHGRPIIKATLIVLLSIMSIFGLWKLVHLIPMNAPEAAIEHYKDDITMYSKQSTAKSQIENRKLTNTSDIVVKIKSVMVNTVQPAPEVKQAVIAVSNVKTTPATSIVTPPVPFYTIVANKATRNMYLLRNSGNGWQTIKNYAIAIGEQPGPKVTSGDKRTPEGYYCIIGKRERNELSSIYGPLAYVLNYPNEEDVKAKRTGQGIWIHGSDLDSSKQATRGCLSLLNKDLLELSTFLKDGVGTPVVIVWDPQGSDPGSIFDFNRIIKDHDSTLAQYSASKELIASLVTKWKDSWQLKDIASYEQFYNVKNFKGDGQIGWRAWKERKIHTFEMYSSIQISIDKITVSEVTSTSATVKFIQVYTSNVSSKENAKKLTLVKSNGQWKISREQVVSKEELRL